MRKIPTLFARDPENRARLLLDMRHVTPGCEWVFMGAAIATRKFDGTCCMLAPGAFVAVAADETTGKTVGWVPMADSPFARMHEEIVDFGLWSWSRRDRERFSNGPLPNVWLGVSIENRRFVGRADVLRETPAAVRFISAEPLLGPLVGEKISHGRHCVCSACAAQDWSDPRLSCCGMHGSSCPPMYAPLGGARRRAGLDLTGIDWTIIGGESGPRHRPMRLEWARDLVAACRVAGSAPFVKQLGGTRPGNKLEDLPEDLRIREMPR